MTNKEYNGWTNYETWLVKLWMDNEEGQDAYWREIAEECVKVDGKENAVRSMAEHISEQHEEAWEQAYSSQTGLFQDLMTSALHEVNWEEIAHHYVDAVEVEVEA